MFAFFCVKQVEKNDGLPEQICKKCLTRLHIAYDFKKDANTTNSELRNFLSKVNKDYEELTAGGSKSKSKTRSESLQSEDIDSFDELDENIEALIEEHEGQHVYITDEGFTDDNDEKPQIVADENNQELVELLGTGNGDLDFQENRTTRHLVTITENASDEPTDGVALYFIEDESEMVSNDSDYIPNEYPSDENTGEMITDELNEPQYLEYDENADQLGDAVSFGYFLQV